MPSADAAAYPPSLAPSKPFSLSLSSKRPSDKISFKPKPSAPKSTSHAHGQKRPYSALADPDSEPEDDANGRHEAVVGFGHDGKAISTADTDRDKNQLLVIKPAKSGCDWREETRRRRGKKNLLPAEAQAPQNGQMGDEGTVERVEVSTVGGLKIAEPRLDGDGDTAMDNGTIDVGKGAAARETKQLTADEEAIAALLGEEKKSNLIIPVVESETAGSSDNDDDEFTNDADRFRADVDSRPLPASLADYNACPVEGFGAGLLRGLGWKDGEAVGKKGAQAAAAIPREVKRRPALLGIGAKETPGGVSGEELGAWNQKKGRGKEKVLYNPLMMRNSKTGEMVTEEELELRKLEAKQGRKDKEEDWRDRRDKNLSIDVGKQKERLAIENGDERPRSGAPQRTRSRDKDRRKDNERRRDRDHGSSRRERSRSRDEDRSSRRERDRSRERERRRKDDDYDRRHREAGSKRRDEDREHDKRSREKDYDQREHARKQKRY